MKYLSVDYGSAIVGIAVSDEQGKIAFPRAEIRNTASLAKDVAKMVHDEGIGLVVVGDTRTLEGAANPITEEVEAFVGDLSRACKVPIELVSEGWSTFEAARFAPKGEEHNDAAAAAVILQRYLDMHPGRVE